MVERFALEAGGGRWRVRLGWLVGGGVLLVGVRFVLGGRGVLRGRGDGEVCAWGRGVLVVG